MAGKTCTMEGPSLEQEESRGMIARAVLQIFNNTHDLEAKGWQVQKDILLLLFPIKISLFWCTTVHEPVSGF